ncbi:MAG: hypothetical protein R3F05_04650 [Planctomycetota bacterium]
MSAAFTPRDQAAGACLVLLGLVTTALLGCGEAAPELTAGWYLPEVPVKATLILASDGRAALIREPKSPSSQPPEVTLYGTWKSAPGGSQLTFDREQTHGGWGPPPGWVDACIRLPQALVAHIETGEGDAVQLRASWLDAAPIPLRLSGTLRNRDDIEQYMTPLPEGAVPEVELPDLEAGSE